jgi:hypothetical protein
MNHLDIYSTSYGQRKGCKSNWQFNSRSLKVDEVRHAVGKLLTKATTLVQTSFRSKFGARVMSVQSPGNPNRDSFETPLWESREKKPFGCGCGGKLQKILYGGRWWFPPNPGRAESSESKCPWLIPTPKGVPECELTLLWLVLDANSSEIILVPLPSLIPRLLIRPSIPPLVLEVGSGPLVPTFRNSTYLDPQVGLARD